MVSLEINFWPNYQILLKQGSTVRFLIDFGALYSAHPTCMKPSHGIVFLNRSVDPIWHQQRLQLGPRNLTWDIIWTQILCWKWQNNPAMERLLEICVLQDTARFCNRDVLWRRSYAVSQSPFTFSQRCSHFCIRRALNFLELNLSYEVGGNKWSTTCGAQKTPFEMEILDRTNDRVFKIMAVSSWYERESITLIQNITHLNIFRDTIRDVSSTLKTGSAIIKLIDFTWCAVFFRFKLSHCEYPV
jgi:hypothetical protein